MRLILFLLLTSTLHAQILPGTEPLTPEPDFSASMVAGIDRLASRLITESKTARKPARSGLKAILGIVDARIPFATMDLVGDTQSPALLYETAGAKIFRVRWPVLEDVHGEGILIQPKGPTLARVVYLPDADTPPEKLVDQLLANSDCEVVIPCLISRDSDFSGSDRLGIHTNQTHREWIQRQAYTLGRHIIGYEIQKTLAVVDWFKAQPNQLPVLVAGIGEGGLLALHAAALDERINAAYVAGYFGPREDLWQEPLYRNVYGLLRDFGDAEVASLIAPRPLAIQHLGFPVVTGPPKPKPGQRSVAAPGSLVAPLFDSVRLEINRALKITPGNWIYLCTQNQGLREIVTLLFPSTTATATLKVATNKDTPLSLPIDPARQKRQLRELEQYTQHLIPVAEAERATHFWKNLPLHSPQAFHSQVELERARFWKESIGRLPDPDLPMHPRSRLVKETDKVFVYEVTMDVWKDVFTWGLLCVPKGLTPGEQRPVVVCQHGLEGLPADTLEEDTSQRAWAAYKAFALRLAEDGFVTYAPHNPYRGGDTFRVLQRKLNPLGLTLFSVIAGQHQRTLEWLQTLPFIKREKIAFYGLSYGGKSAMRLPAILPGYCMSICSGDFNEWIRKCASTDMPMSYLYVGEHEIWDWNLARNFNYAEMAALIAPRPFMVERGHNDGVATDEWVNYEFAKVRRLYDKLGIGERALIEHFDGPHTIHGEGTFSFLKRHLGPM